MAMVTVQHRLAESGAIGDQVCGMFFPRRWWEYITEDQDQLVHRLQAVHADLAAVPLSTTADRIQG